MSAPLPCPEEGCAREAFLFEGALRDHLKSRHRWDQAQIDEHFATPATDGFQCPHCPRSFANFHGRQIHIARSHGENAVSKQPKPAAKPQREVLAAVVDVEPVTLEEPEWVEYTVSLDASLAEQVEAWCWLNRCDLGERIGDLLADAIAGDRDVTKLVKMRAERGAA